MSACKIHHIFQLTLILALQATKLTSHTEIHGEFSKAYRINLFALEERYWISNLV